MFTWVRLHWKISLLFVCVIVGGGIWIFTSRTQAQKKKLVFEQPQIRTLTQELEVSGRVDAKQKAVLKFLAGGKLTYVGAKEGDVVRKGQTIASIDARDLKKTLEKNLNLYTIQRSTIDQNKYARKDIHGNYTTDQQNYQDQLTLENTVTTVELQDIALKNASLYSPMAGILIASPKQVAGTIVSSTDTFTVINPESMMFSADVGEVDISQVREGMMAEVELDSYQGQKIPTRVERVAYQSSEASTGTVFAVEFLLPSSFTGVTYRLGMNGSVHILLDKKENVLSIPVRSLIERDGKTFVEVRDGNKTTMREVTLGLETDEYREVIHGVTTSDMVVVR